VVFAPNGEHPLPLEAARRCGEEKRISQNKERTVMTALDRRRLDSQQNSTVNMTMAGVGMQVFTKGFVMRAGSYTLSADGSAADNALLLASLSTLAWKNKVLLVYTHYFAKHTQVVSIRSLVISRSIISW
jgi:hypothetical protein